MVSNNVYLVACRRMNSVCRPALAALRSDSVTAGEHRPVHTCLCGDFSDEDNRYPFMLMPDGTLDFGAYLKKQKRRFWCFRWVTGLRWAKVPWSRTLVKTTPIA
jgi:hypothetical protein